MKGLLTRSSCISLPVSSVSCLAYSQMGVLVKLVKRHADRGSSIVEASMMALACLLSGKPGMSGEGRKQISWVNSCAVTGGTVGRGSHWGQTPIYPLGTWWVLKQNTQHGPTGSILIIF